MDGDAINQLKNDNFKDKQEYYLYKGIVDDCMRLLKGARFSYYFTTEKIVNQFNEIVQKTIRQAGYSKWKYHEVGLHLLIACQLKHEPEFMQNYAVFQRTLLDKAISVLKNPSGEVLKKNPRNT